MASTAAEHLVLVNAAITAILEGRAVESYTIGSRNLRKTPLSELFKLRSQLEAEAELDAAEGTGGGLHTYPDFWPNG
ncbi:MAG TPA: hypothetical protein PLE19_12665 [Planctomycetota bacterium]|nr:hypothetical protein [Planctomycetota bacterium]HRT95533.1 hypothetical protein [Planctomycetota bacterium]